MVRLLVGNKCDMESERVVSRERAELLASEQEIPLLETSAKTNVNIDKTFEMLARLILEKVCVTCRNISDIVHDLVERKVNIVFLLLAIDY